MIEGISHLTFVVEDLERASGFFRAVFDAREVYASGEREFSLGKEKFFLIGSLWVCIMQGEALCVRTYNHVAFKIHEEEFDGYEARIRALGLEVRPGRPRVPGEGRSLYFYDFDNHLFELHTSTLEGRLEVYKG